MAVRLRILTALPCVIDHAHTVAVFLAFLLSPFARHPLPLPASFATFPLPSLFDPYFALVEGLFSAVFLSDK